MDKKIVAAYCRTANADDLAIEMQKKLLCHYAVEHGYGDHIVFYVDNGYSGVNPDRPAFQKLTRDIATGKVKAIIAHSLSRVGRDSGMLLKWFLDLQEKGVSLSTVADPDATEVFRILWTFGEVKAK